MVSCSPLGVRTRASYHRTPCARHFVRLCPRAATVYAFTQSAMTRHVQALIPFLDAIHGSHRVIAERGGHGGHRSLDAWMQGPGAGLRRVPDIVLDNFDGAQSFLLIDVKTLDAADLTHVLTRHTDRVRLAAPRCVTKRAVEEEYGALPTCMRSVVLPISTFQTLAPLAHPAMPSLVSLVAVCVPLSPTPSSPAHLGPPPTLHPTQTTTTPPTPTTLLVCK